MEKHELAQSVAENALKKAPELTTGSGVGTAMLAWLSENPDLITSIAGLVGMFVGMGGLAWMVYRDIKWGIKRR